MAEYRIVRDSLADRFMRSRAKVRVYAGGFANGKTAASCILAIQLAKAYPGSNGLIARATLRKTNDTIRKEFRKWLPSAWIKTFPMPEHDASTCVLKNGSMINFRFIAQQGKTSESTSSNQLSATFDWIVIDQVEDPEIIEKDFDDLVGRLRGSTKYKGDDPTMPRTGPRWIVLTANPTANWFYQKLIRPCHLFASKGIVHEDLLIVRDADGKPILGDDGRVQPIIEIFEGSTYENKQNLPSDFIQLLESRYTGQMRDRFLRGEWVAYEGLVYDAYNTRTHSVPHALMMDKLHELQQTTRRLTFVEGLDYGISKPSAYMLGFVDLVGNIHWFHEMNQAEMAPASIIGHITQTRLLHNVPDTNKIYADPALWKGTAGRGKEVRIVVADEFANHFNIRPSNNELTPGITKVRQYLATQPTHRHAYTNEHGGPFMYFSDALDKTEAEIVAYYWAKDKFGDSTDKPIERNDHSLDAIRYAVVTRPEVSELDMDLVNRTPRWLRGWQEEVDSDRHRYRRSA